MKTIKGNCHCGDVQFEIKSSLKEFTTCDCSLCTMRNAIMVKVPEADVSITAGKDSLSLYQWNMKIAKHYFCKSCGIYVFHNKRSGPDYMGVNVNCLQNTGDTAVEIHTTSGYKMSVNKAEAKPHWPGPRE